MWGGETCAAVANTATITGYDISQIAVDKARLDYQSSTAQFGVASADHIPLPDSTLDGIYSFEVLEHLWDPAVAICEMARVIKPGGFLLVSCPHHFSLDLNLSKRFPVRVAEVLCASLVYVQHLINRTRYINLVPDIDGTSVYPDCDQVSSLLSWNLSALLRRTGLTPEFIDMFYMCAQRPGSSTNLAFQKNAALPFIRWFGDHILFFATKNPESPNRVAGD